MRRVVFIALLLQGCTFSFGVTHPASAEELKALREETATALKDRDSALVAVANVLQRYKEQYPLKVEAKKAK